MLTKFGFPIMLLVTLGAGCAPAQQKINTTTTSLASMHLTSPAFEHNKNIPSKYTCDGDNVNPPLTILDIPTETKSLALLVDDPDAPNGTFVHWVVWNISPTTKEIHENSVPAGAVQGTTSFGKIGWGGPCPPNGVHRYFFKIAALNTVVDMPAGTKANVVAEKITPHVIARAELVGLYKRQR